MKSALLVTLIVFGIFFLVLMVYAGLQIGSDITVRSMPVLISMVVVLGLFGLGLLALAGLSLYQTHQTKKQQHADIVDLKNQMAKLESKFEYRLTEKFETIDQSIKDRQPLSTKDRIDHLLKIAEKMQVTKEIKEGEKHVVKKKIPEEIVHLIKAEIEGMRDEGEV